MQWNLVVFGEFACQQLRGMTLNFLLGEVVLFVHDLIDLLHHPDRKLPVRLEGEM